MIMIARARVALSVQLAGNHCNGYTKGNQARTAPRVFRLVAFPQDKAATPAIMLRKSRDASTDLGKPTNKEQPQVCLDHRPLCRSEAPTDNTMST